MMKTALAFSVSFAVMARSCQSRRRREEKMSVKTTHVRHLDHAVAWDESEQRHVYLADADLVFRGSEILHVGPGYAGPADSVVEGAGFMAIPGLVNVHRHPFSEPAHQGPPEQAGSPK